MIKNMTVGDRPRFIEALAGDAIYVANSGSNTVSVINPANNTVIKNIEVGANPSSIHRYGNAIFIANSESNTVSVINPANNTVIKNITVGASPGSIYGFGDTVYVANGESNTVSVIDLNP